MSAKGGNTTTIYAVEDAHQKKVDSLIKQHPDVVQAKMRFIGKKTKRIHHVVNYRPFKDIKLIPIPDLIVPETPNEYGMKLIKKDEFKIKLTGLIRETPDS